MQKVLTQDEIDGLFRAAQPGAKQADGGFKRKIEKYDLNKSKTLSMEQLRIINTLHESLARRLGDSLGTYLRTGLEMNLASAEQLRFEEFLGRIPELSYMASLRLMPIDAQALIQLDLSLVFPIVDLALGGSGADLIEPREVTEIEEQIIETVINLIAQSMQVTWAPVVAFDIQFDQRQPLAQVHNLMLPNERILSLNFEIHLLQLRGTLNIALPAVVANALLAKLSVRRTFENRVPSQNLVSRVRSSVLESKFLAELILPPSPLTIRELLNITPGYVLAMPRNIREPVHLNIAGKPMFEAHPSRKGTSKAARIERRCSLVQAARIEGAAK
jgi:flagellar motor switch protein FliM